MSDSEDMTEFASIVERIERGESKFLPFFRIPPGSSIVPMQISTPRRVFYPPHLATEASVFNLLVSKL
ncbi:unnamed protein product [Boreogadus saida]